MLDKTTETAEQLRTLAPCVAEAIRHDLRRAESTIENVIDQLEASMAAQPLIDGMQRLHDNVRALRYAAVDAALGGST